MALPKDYLERVYAGVLGKIIGVYLGRPFEQWSHERIDKELGEIHYYVHERLNAPLVVTDDDISGTFTFVRALEDYGNSKDLTARQIGQTWLNYIIENRTILWWGGMGTSTEHTAFLRLKNGIEAPGSGSIETNGPVVAEQIGAQIFIDGWGMVAPGQPDLAASFAKRAGSVSHDGEAIYGAQVVAAMEAQAFVEKDLNKLLDVGVSFIPKQSTLYRMIAELREFRARQSDWRKCFHEVMRAKYSYDHFGGGCHMVPNHGLIILALLYGDDEFQKSLMIVNTLGWDTDCNSANVGCIMGIKNGLAGIDTGPDWRGPVADRMYLPTADGGSCITDAVRETIRLVNMGRALAGEKPIVPKDGARFHFELPGSVQGFMVEQTPESKGTATLRNVERHSQAGKRSLLIRYDKLAAGRVARVSTPTFVPPEAAKMGGYGVFACPTLYPGQSVTAALQPCSHNTHPAMAKLYLRHYAENDELTRVYGPEVLMKEGQPQSLTWRVPEVGGQPIAEIGLEISGSAGLSGTVFLDYLTWRGEPDFTTAGGRGSMGKKAWVNGMSSFNEGSRDLQFVQNEGRGLLIIGTRDWRNTRVTAALTPNLAKAFGVATRVQGMRRYYALLLCDDGKARLVKQLDGEKVLAETACPWDLYQPHELSLQASGNRLTGWVNGKSIIEAHDIDHVLDCGGIGLVLEEGRCRAEVVTVKPA